jgi:DNA-binding NarL/FixJ family response regulator
MASVHFSPRQDEVISLIADGLTDKEIAVRLSLTQRTVRTYIERVFARHAIHNRAGAVRVWLGAQRSRAGSGAGENADLLVP